MQKAYIAAFTGLFAAFAMAPQSIAQTGAPEAALTTIRIGQQPQRWALEWYIASEKGWWKDVGLKPEFSTFSSGAVEIGAGASGSWDVGGAGNIPSVLGASKYGLITIGIADEEAGIITIMATKDKADEYLKNPGLMKGKTIPVTTNSTGQWGAAECLAKKFGLKPDDYRFVNLSPPDINAAVMSGKYDLTEAWAPNTYILEDAIGAKVICTGAELKMPIHSYLFASPGFAEKNPEAVAKFLAVYLRAVGWERANPKETENYLKAWFNSVGVKFPDKYLAQELHDRPAYTLSEQLKIFAGAPAPTSDIVKWWNEVGKFMVSVGVISKIPDPKTTVSEKFLKMVDSDPKLKAFATEFAK
jgi:NitT/TauT family transport system substrate-binding protein